MHLCRLSIAWGLPQTEIEQTVAARDVDEMLEYYEREPWGAYRDNLHAAIIAREVQRPNLKTGARIDLEQFMVVHPEDRELHRQHKEATRKAGFLEMLKAMAIRRFKDGRPG